MGNCHCAKWFISFEFSQLSEKNVLSLLHMKKWRCAMLKGRVHGHMVGKNVTMGSLASGLHPLPPGGLQECWNKMAFI